MKHPYKKFEQTSLWNAIDAAVADLVKNKDLELRTTREHIIGYLCRQLSTQGVVTEDSIRRKGMSQD